MTFKKISFRLLLWIGGVSIVPLLLIFSFLLNSFEKAQTDLSKKYLSQAADMKLNQINTYIEERLVDIRLLAKDQQSNNNFEKIITSYYQSGVNDEVYKQLDVQTRNQYNRLLEEGYYDVLFVSMRGDIVYSSLHEADFASNLFTGEYKDSALAKVVNESMLTLGESISKFNYYEPSNDKASFLASPVLKNGQLLGAVALQINTHKLYSVINDDTGLGRSGEVVVGRKEKNNIVFMAPLKYQPAAELSYKVSLGVATAGPMQNALIGKRGSGIALDYRNKDVIAAWRYLPALNWGLVVKQDMNEAYEGFYLLRNSSMLILALFLLLLLFASWRTTRSIVRPIEELTEACSDIAKGNITKRVKNDGEDEIAILAISFNMMADKVQNSHDSLEEQVKDRTTVLEQVNKSLAAEIEQRKKAEQSLRLSSSVFEHSSEGIIITDAKSNIIDCNQAYCRITGYSAQEMMGQNPGKVSSGLHDKDFYTAMWESINKTGCWVGEILDRRKNGEVYPKRLSVNAVINENNEVSHYVGVFSDISELKATEKKLENLAFKDALTSLPNRQLFNDRVEQEITHAHRHKEKLALMFLDLDQFKRVNDVHGHHIGDELLREVAHRLLLCVRENDTVARLGGDEFTIILTDLSDASSAAILAEKIIEEISKPILVQQYELFVGTSIGISIYPDDSGNKETLLRHADTAMYHAKEQGRGNYKFFSEELERINQDRNLIENDLRNAIKEQQFEVYYQPQVDIASNKLTGAEALIRWNHPERGLISPLSFIPIAEENGMIIEIGKWVFNQACSLIHRQLDSDIEPVKIAVNLSAVQFKDAGLIEMIEDALNTYHLESKWIELEITESVIMDDAEKTIKILQNLKDLGLTLSIDDFGTGYSSLAYLKRFPISKLKIDREFIKDLTKDKDDDILTISIIQLAKGLGLDVLAEGAETAEQISFLKDNNCQYVQGYFYSKPLPEKDFLDYRLRT